MDLSRRHKRLILAIESGVTRVRGEFWRARSAACGRLGPGDRVRIVQRDSLLLEVEPAIGGAS